MSFDDRANQKIGGILSAIPGYQGYRDKENRRDADRRVREQLASKLGAQADRVEQIARDLANQRRMTEISPVDSFAQSLRHLINRISTASYGYGGLFSDRDVDANALDQLRQFDEAMLKSADKLNSSISALEEAFTKGNSLVEPATTGATAVRELLAQFDLRNDVITTAKPAPPESVLKVLDKPVSKTDQIPATYNLHDRDALAILGDNFIVDARIDIQAAPISFRLFRLGTAPETWLFAPNTSEIALALLTPAPISDDNTGTSIGGVNYQVRNSGSGRGQVTGIGGQSDTQSVSYQLLTTDLAHDTKWAVILDWSGNQQIFTGSQVHPDDIEIFGSTTT